MRKLADQEACRIVWRLQNGETQADLAAEFGVSQGYISKLANGQIKWFEVYKKKCDCPPPRRKGE